MMHWLSQDGRAPDEPGHVFRFAANFAEQPLRLGLRLVSDNGNSSEPQLEIESRMTGIQIECEPGNANETSSSICVFAVVPSTNETDRDDDIEFDIHNRAGQGIPPCHVILRRTRCQINTTLANRHKPGEELSEEAARALQFARATLLWHGWNRYEEVVCLKRCASGLSGNQVLVFRPKLRDPFAPGNANPHFPAERGNSETWGCCLLVKTGPQAKIRREWDRYQTYLSDRLHPFIARGEEYLSVSPPNTPVSGGPLATVVGSFLGTELLHVETLELLVRADSEQHIGQKIVDRLFGLTGVWYSGAVPHPLKRWRKMFQFTDDQALLLFGRFDLSQEPARIDYADSVAWDVSFVRERHLSHYLLGQNRDGLLFRITDLPVRYSLIHGDLHPRNVLVDHDNAWLLDFAETGVGPTLYDFTVLEVNLRLCCLELTPSKRNFEWASAEWESLLLDHMTGTDSGLGKVQSLALEMGARPEALLHISESILAIRRQALPFTTGGPDRRDYLAVLFLTILDVLRYAGKDSGTGRVENYRLLMSLFWLLEDTLSQSFGMEPFPRQTKPMEYKCLLSRQWLAAPGAPQRVAYSLQREDGCKALAPVAATRGVLQNSKHHLDVFDHTLLMLAYLEALLNDDAGFPLNGFLDHEELDRQVEHALFEQRLRFPPIATTQRAMGLSQKTEVVAPWMSELQDSLRVLLTEDMKLCLKWAALFHDVGKPATRGMSANGDDAKETVCFLGHERYGRQLVADDVHHLYPGKEGPDPAMRSRLNNFIDNHHVHHQIANRFLKDKPEEFASILQAASENRLPDGSELRFLEEFWGGVKNPIAEDFPLLMLHGYADTLACRGPEADTPITQVAQLDLALLRLFFLYDASASNRRRAENGDHHHSGAELVAKPRQAANR